jgi:Tfp pilus assembly protein PilF
MRFSFSICLRVFLFIAMAALICGCTKQAKKARFEKRADGYFASGEFEKAKIEYLNVLRLEPQNQNAIERMALIWSEQGAPIRALPFLLKAKELNASNLEIRHKLAMAAMAVGDFGSARKEAAAILEQAPGDGEALLIFVDSTRTKEGVDEVEEQLKKFPNRETPHFLLASAGLAAARGDKAGSEAALRKAVELDPKSSIAHAGMAGV